MKEEFLQYKGAQNGAHGLLEGNDPTLRRYLKRFKKDYLKKNQRGNELGVMFEALLQFVENGNTYDAAFT